MAGDVRYLVAMNQSIARIVHYCRPGQGEFLDSPMRQHAVQWNLQLLSICARRVSDTVKARHNQVAWRRLEGLCREVIGDPWSTNPQRLWECVQEDLPQLRDQICGILVERRSR